jgi:cupin fold WbuC family metalloprotein
MKIDQKLLDELTAKAKVNPRHRMHYDLRDSEEEMSMRMLNAIEPETVIPIHRHADTSEDVIVLRGEAVEEVLRFLHAVWQFCSYVFVPQWGRIKRNE